MNGRQELLDALLAERYDNRWWKSRGQSERPGEASGASRDDDLTIARRRRDLLAAVDHRDAS